MIQSKQPKRPNVQSWCICPKLETAMSFRHVPASRDRDRYGGSRTDNISSSSASQPLQLASIACWRLYFTFLLNHGLFIIAQHSVIIPSLDSSRHIFNLIRVHRSGCILSLFSAQSPNLLCDRPRRLRNTLHHNGGLFIVSGSASWKS